MILSSSSSSHPPSFEEQPPRAPFTSFSNYSSSSSNTITTTSPRSPPSPLSPPEEDFVELNSLQTDHLPHSASSPIAAQSRPTLASESSQDKPTTSFSVLRGSRKSSLPSPGQAGSWEGCQPSDAATVSLGPHLSSLPTRTASSSRSSLPHAPPLQITIPTLDPSSSTPPASVPASSASQSNPLAHTFGLAPAKRRRRVKSVSKGDREVGRGFAESSSNGQLGRGSSLSSSEFDLISSAASFSTSPKKERTSGSSRRSSTKVPVIPPRRWSLVGSPEGLSSAECHVRSSSPSAYLDPLASFSTTSEQTSPRARSFSAPNLDEQVSSPNTSVSGSSAQALPTPSSPRSKRPQQPDDEESSCSCSTVTTSSEDQTQACETGPLTPGGPELDSFPFLYEKDLARVTLERNGKGKERMQPSFPSSRSLAFGESSEDEGTTETFVDALDESFESLALKKVDLRSGEGPATIPVGSGKTGKVDKRVFKLWELVEGEVAYTEDLVTLVHIYLHHLFLLPSFTPARRAAITRNTLELLMLHKRFSKALVTILREEGVMEGSGVEHEERNIISATRRVAEVFVLEADDFASYEEYCAGHDEALVVIRQVESTPEWISYERRCSNLARSRTRQTLTRLLSSPSASYAGRLPLPSATTPITTTFPEDASSRLMLRDLLIKPIQRICRYPLVLASLLGSQLSREGGGELERALGAMKVVALGVDEATRKKAARGRSDVIRERMELHPTLTPSVLRSLDQCLLVGSLEVIYEHSTYAPLLPPVKVRYLAAFLYAGYLILCKIKKGKIYHATFFMPLKSVQIVEGNQLGSDSLLPDSFRLVGHGYFYELATSGRKERDIWLEALKTAKAATTPWTIKPPTSAPEIFPPRQIARRMSSYASDLPTAVSIPTEMTKRLSMPEDSLAASQSTDVFDELDSTPIATEPPNGGAFPVISTPTPRSRSQSSSLIVAPTVVSNPNNLFRRSSSGHREAVDRSLADIFSESCSTARNLAQLDKGGSLYSSPSKSTTGSSIGIAVSTVRRKMNSGTGSLSRRSSFVDMRPLPPPSSSMPMPREEHNRVEEVTSKLGRSSGITRTKSEVGLKRDSFLRRSSMMPLWSFEPQTTTSESPIENEEDDPLRFGQSADYVRPPSSTVEIERSAAVKRSRTESGFSATSSVAVPPSDVLASELGKLLFPLASSSPEEMVPLHARDKPPSSFRTMKESIKRRSSFVEGWSARSKSVPASPTGSRQSIPLPVVITKSTHAPFHGEFSPLSTSPPLPRLPTTIVHSLPAFKSPPTSASAAIAVSTPPSSSPMQSTPSSQRESVTPLVSRPGLLRRSLSSLSRRRTKSSTSLPAIDAEMTANVRNVSASLNHIAPLPETALVSPINVPGIDPLAEIYDPTRPSRSRTSSADASSFGNDSSSGVTSSASSDDGHGGGPLTINLKRRKSSLRWGGFARGLSLTPLTPTPNTTTSPATTPP